LEPWLSAGVRRPGRGYLLVTLALFVVARGGLGLSDEAAAGWLRRASMFAVEIKRRVGVWSELKEYKGGGNNGRQFDGQAACFL
jgi:hypothetical protein